MVSGLFSTGGGMILVPALVYLIGFRDSKARGTTILCILPMVITSSIFYYKSNYIDWKIAILCAIGGTNKNFKNSIHNIFSLCQYKNDFWLKV